MLNAEPGDVEFTVAMSRQRGKAAELDYATSIYERTQHRLFPQPVGYSGNHDIPAPDLAIDDGHKIHAFELKTSKKDRLSVTHDPADRGNDDLAQLIEYAREFPRTVVAHVGVVFTRRQMTIATLWIQGDTIKQVLDGGVATCETRVNRTRSNNLSFHKPELDDWTSASKGDDVRYMLERMNYDGPLLPPA